MTDFKKLFKLQWKKNAIWIILLIIATLLINTINFKYNTEDIYKGLTESVSSFEKNLKIENDKRLSKNKELDKSYIEYGDELRDRIVKKYNIVSNEELSKMDTDEIDKYYAKERSEEYYTVESLVSTYDMYRDDITDENSQYGLMSQYENFFMFPFLFILSMLFTSIEQMTNYFDFTRMYPWSKTKDFAMKLIFGLLLTLVVFGIHIGVERVLMASAGLGKLYEASRLGIYFVKELIFYWLIFVIFMSTGAVSGNIFGHFGLNIISFGLVDISVLDITTVQKALMGLSYDQTLSNKFDTFFEKQGEIFQYILSPLRSFKLSNELLIAYSIIAAIVFIIGFLVVKNMKTENSGFMVVNKPIKIFSLILASFTLSSLIFTIVTSTFADYNMYIGIVLYLFFLFGSYKLFKALFNIKIKV